MFVVLLSWLWIMSRKAKKIKQFDIVFAGETPFKPETTHFSHNMFAPMYKAIGFLLENLEFSRDYFGSPAYRFSAEDHLGNRHGRLAQIRDGRWELITDYLR